MSQRIVDPQELDYFRQLLRKWVDSMPADELATYYRRVMNGVVREKLDKLFE